VSHLGHRLSALIDGELDGGERERVLVHISRCRSCQDEAAALRTLKRRMSALGEAGGAGGAGAGLTVRLMGLGAAGLGGMAPAEAMWPQQVSWPPETHAGRDPRTGRYVFAGSLAVFLAGLGTAAFIAGGESQAQAPAPPVLPSVDVQLFSHQLNDTPAQRAQLRPESISPLPRPHTGPK
jgi:anti-sigma factor RsiW